MNLIGQNASITLTRHRFPVVKLCIKSKKSMISLFIRRGYGF